MWDNWSKHCFAQATPALTNLQVFKPVKLMLWKLKMKVKYCSIISWSDIKEERSTSILRVKELGSGLLKQLGVGTVIEKFLRPNYSYFSSHLKVIQSPWRRKQHVPPNCREDSLFYTASEPRRLSPEQRQSWEPQNLFQINVTT
jgi:hypothetical protein